MSLAAAATLWLVPPPLENDERTEVLDVIRRFSEASIAGDEEAFAELLDPAGTTYVSNSRMHVPDAQSKPNSEVISGIKYAKGVARESTFGTPTVLIRWNMAQVWVPYRTSIDGKLSHCGIDNFSLTRRWGKWRVTNISYTVEFASSCGELGMAEKAGE